MPKQPTHVRVRHTDGRLWDCPVRALPHWREQGWTPVDEKTEKTSTPKKQASSSTTNPTTPAGD